MSGIDESLPFHPVRIAVLTVSDTRTPETDKSGDTLVERLTEAGHVLADRHIVEDDRAAIVDRLKAWIADPGIDVILTTGGTGLGPRDVTPEATLAVVDRQVPGLAEAMRAKSLEITSRAMLSRAVAGMRNKTLIINLPGSPKGVQECLEVILPALEHGLAIMKGEASECARH